MKKVFIVILNFNGGGNTLQCLSSLFNMDKSNEFELEVIVVDNGSKDNSANLIREKFSDVTLIENSQNLGFTGGCNEGLRFALKSGAEYVILLNNDTLVHKSMVKNLVLAAAPFNTGGVVPKIYFEKGYEFHKRRYKKEDLGKVIWYAGGRMDWANLIGENIGVDEVDYGQFGSLSETELATGCCFLIKAEVLKKIGLFEDKYFLYYEDADISQRILKAGFKIIYQPKAVLWHKNAESSGGSGSDLQDYYITRNRLLFGLSYAPIPTKIALMRESLRLLQKGRKWQKKGVLDFYLRRFGRGTFPI